MLTKISGKLLTDEDGNLCVKMQISPQNPNLYDIPLEEVLEDYLNREVHIEVFPVELREGVLKQ